MSEALHAGAERFSGFADLYDAVRPQPPALLGDLLAAYVGGRPRLVVDLGSGTGLSTRWARTWADEAVGVEPSDDMRTAAAAAATPGVAFRAGWSHATGLPDRCADVVLAVQALHWMEPEPTFAEVARILRPGGVFAAVDCDWPPVVGDAASEQAWETCRRRLRALEARAASAVDDDDLRRPLTPAELADEAYSAADAHRDRTLPGALRSWAKSDHLRRMRASGRFRWCREVACVAEEQGDGARFLGLLRSQGDYQGLRRRGLSDADLGADAFASVVADRLGDRPRPWWFVYRARLGVVA